jgi:hypothetical protein
VADVAVAGLGRVSLPAAMGAVMIGHEVPGDADPVGVKRPEGVAAHAEDVPSGCSSEASR